MWRSLKLTDPGSLTILAPLCPYACQTQNTAPSGSVKTPVRPAPGTSNGSLTTAPPASRTFAAALSALSTQMYVSHIAVGVADSGIDPTAATAPPRRRAMKYLPADPCGITFSNCQPKSPR